MSEVNVYLIELLSTQLSTYCHTQSVIIDKGYINSNKTTHIQ